ncbi:MAG: hypothetical protein WCF36_20145 [Candidatus Nanopelagicales bacterium]
MSQDPVAADPRTADVYTVLDDLSDIVETARAMPMSDKCVIPRNEVLDLLDTIRSMLPAAVQEAEELLADRVGVVEEGYREAERVVSEANREVERVLGEANREVEHVLADASGNARAMIEQASAQQAHLVTTHEVTRVALDEAESIRGQARTEAEQMRVEIDQYVEDKFAAFEASLTKTLAAVQRGRDRIRERYGFSAPEDDYER